MMGDLRDVLTRAVESQEPGALSTPGLAYTVDELLAVVAEPDNRSLIRELWRDFDKAFPKLGLPC